MKENNIVFNPQAKNKIFNLKHIFMMLVPLLSCIIIHLLYIKITSIILNTFTTLLYLKFLIPLIIGLVISIKFIRNNYDYQNRINFKVIILSLLSFVIAYGIVSFTTENLYKYIKLNISTTIINYIIDGIEMIIIFLITKLLCQKESINNKTVYMSIFVISAAEFVIRAKRVHLLLFMKEFGFSSLFLLQVLSIFCSVACMIIPAYAISLYNEIKKDA